MKIDGHVNITQDGKWFNTNHNASLQRLLNEMPEAGIDKCLLITMPFASNNTFTSSVVEKYPDKFRGMGFIDFTRDNFKEQVDEIENMGLSGIKIHPRMQQINCLDKNLEPLFQYLNEKKKVVMIDGYYQAQSKNVFLKDLHPFNYDILAKQYPEIRLIISHIGAHLCFDLYFVSKSNSNLFINNSHVLKYFEGTSLMNDYTWIMDKLDEKILYGSDFPEYGLSEYRESFERLVNMVPSLRKELIYTNIARLIPF